MITPQDYATTMEQGFYKALGLQASEELVVNARDIAEKKDAILEWMRTLNEQILGLPTHKILELYTALEANLRDKKFDIVFDSNADSDPKQAMHPVMRALDFTIHHRMSVQAHSEREVELEKLQQSTPRFSELGDGGEVRDCIIHLFLDVDIKDETVDYLPTREALQQAIKFEAAAQTHVIDPKELVENPAILVARLSTITGLEDDALSAHYFDREEEGARSRTAPIMMWQMVANHALGQLTLEKLLEVRKALNPIDDFGGLETEDNPNAYGIVQRHVDFFVASNPKVATHVEWHWSMPRHLFSVDSRIASIVQKAGDWPANIEAALNRAIGAEHAAAELTAEQK